MLPPIPKLPALIARFIKVKSLGQRPDTLPFEPEKNPLVGTQLAEDDPCTIPFRGRLQGDKFNDGFYLVNVFLDPSLQIPSHCLVDVLFWTVDLESPELSITIIKANVVSTIFAPEESALCRAETSPLLAPLLHNIRYKRIVEYPDQQEISSQSSANSALFSSNIQKVLQPTQEQFSQPMSEIPETPAAMEATPVKAETPAQVGFSSEKRKWEFREKPTETVKSQEDMMSAIKPQPDEFEDFTEEDMFRALREEIGIPQEGTYQEHEDVGIDVFPSWALEYLKFYYKV